ncbi:MAG: M20/M25/M40 family metallo-hydrolase [Chitinophagaceae bacterium]|nr:M20/M25/M40 family metallo-hydrolase [Chitinophagaceae bacterium]
MPAMLNAQKEKIDQNMMKKIRTEGLENSRVMDIAFQLTDVNGPRVTNSIGQMKAAHYVQRQLADWGLENSRLDEWGDFGKGWDLEKSYVAMTAPWYRSFSAYPKVWTDGTDGPQSGHVLLVSAKDSAALEGYRGRLKGKVLIIDNLIDYKQSFKPDASRWTDEQLKEMANWKPTPPDTAAMRQRMEQFRRRGGFGGFNVLANLKKMAQEEGALLLLSTGARNHDGTVFVQQAGPYKLSDPANFPEVALGLEDYNMIVRLLRADIPVKMDMDIQTSFRTNDTKGYNVIAEIPGTDKNLKDQVVMLGGHLDSWQGANGATDNAAGSAVMMEAVRILKALGVQPRRTIRIALWTGEEQGLMGSRGYVTKTFGDRRTMQLVQPNHDNFSVYFNLDNGTGRIRGVYMQGNEEAGKIFSQWLVPFHDLDAKTITLQNTGGTDHLSFDAIGLPGFQFIQDEVEYDTRTHHSNMDSYDHLVADDLKQAATIVAAFVYNAAMRDQKIPRKEMPQAGANRFPF